MFDTSRELYAEDEFDDIGVLIYRPPPLHDVWLTLEELRERRNEMDEQRRRQSLRTKAGARARAQKNDEDDHVVVDVDSQPRLVFDSDSDTGDEGSVLDDSSPVPVFDSEGGNDDNIGWDDHPSSAVSPNAQSSSRGDHRLIHENESEVPSSLGRGPGGKS